MKHLLFATALLAMTAFADDRVRDVQAELKTQGFFYGAVDGKEGPETTAAIRRFQIRNGLKVTGTLSEDTLGALGIGGTPAPAKPEVVKPAPGKEPTMTPPKAKTGEQLNPPPPGGNKPSTPPRGRDILRDDAPQNEPPREMRPRLQPDDPSMIPPPRSIPPPVADDWSTFYHGTPYATAPREVQMSVLRKALDQLASRRFYRAVPDGYPGPATNEALFLYQEQRRLSRTGRLDLQTLAALELLPGRGPDAPPLKPFYNPNRRRDQSVERPGFIR